MDVNWILQKTQPYHGNIILLKLKLLIMKIKVCKDYLIDKSIYEYDCYRASHYDTCFTIFSNYMNKWETIEVTNEELLDYINKGYAIKINC